MLDKPFKDLTGMVFGNLTVIERVPINGGKRHKWRCKCTCGKETLKTRQHLEKVLTPWCGNKLCSPKYRIGDIVNGREILSFKSGTRMAVLKCVRCGKLTKSAPHLMKHKCICQKLSLKESLFSQFKGHRRTKEIGVELSAEEHYLLITKNCFYCGSPPDIAQKKRKYVDSSEPKYFNGIDRIDSSKGYSVENCVPCCSKCNYAKRVLSTDEFYSNTRDRYIHSVVKTLTNKQLREDVDVLLQEISCRNLEGEICLSEKV